VWPGQGTTIVALHGLLDSSAGWTALCRSTHRPCVAPDLGGFGSSSLPERPSLRAYAEDVVRALDRLGIGDVVLVGHSLGGGVATALAERQPDRVQALVLLAPAGFGRIPLAEAISIPGVRIVAERLLPFALGSRLTVGTAYRIMVANGQTPTDELLKRIVDGRGELADGAREATKAVVRAGLARQGFHRRPVDYGGPVVVVWGDRDRIVPIGHMAGVAAAFPHAETEVWSDMGHHPQVERPADLARLVETTCRRSGANTRLRKAG
jgi:pimeloyl-ACP methyl ester carboxylesterase